MGAHRIIPGYGILRIKYSLVHFWVSSYFAATVCHSWSQEQRHCLCPQDYYSRKGDLTQNDAEKLVWHLWFEGKPEGSLRWQREWHFSGLATGQQGSDQVQGWTWAFSLRLPPRNSGFILPPHWSNLSPVSSEMSLVAFPGPFSDFWISFNWISFTMFEITGHFPLLFSPFEKKISPFHFFVNLLSWVWELLLLQPSCLAFLWLN